MSDKTDEEELVNKFREDLIAYWEKQPSLDYSDDVDAKLYRIHSAFHLETARAIAIVRMRRREEP